jgi:hypothetical protein
VMVTADPEPELVRTCGLGGLSPCSYFWNMARSCSLRQAQSALDLTGVPFKKTNGFGSTFAENPAVGGTGGT